MPVYLIDRRAVKEEAKALIRGASVSPLRFTALFLIIDLALSLIGTAADYMLGDAVSFSSLPFSFIGILSSLISTVLMAGYNCYCLGVQQGKEMPYVSLFDAFPFAGRVILLSILEGLAIALGMVLFIVPGLILAFSYAFSIYLLCEEPDAGVIRALRRSRELMKGYKWQMFTLLMSFLPLLVLVAIPSGLCHYLLRGVFSDTLSGKLLSSLVDGTLAAAASLYITPYIELSLVSFYRRVIGPVETGNGAEESRPA